MDEENFLNPHFINLETGDPHAPDRVKYPRFSPLGEGYPHALEEQFERILTKIDNAWGTDSIDEVFTELIIDKRGGRQGFPNDALNDIFRLKEFHHSQKILAVEHKTQAISQLVALGIPMTNEAFMATINHGDQKMLDLFLKAGFAFTHLRGEQDASPLMVALKKGYTVCASMLLMAGDYPNFKDRLGLTPLLISCGKPTKGYRMISEQLIIRGAHTNVTDPMGNSPLLLALSSGLLDLAKLLIRHDAKTDLTNKAGDNAATLLLDHCDPSDPDYQEVSQALLAKN